MANREFTRVIESNTKIEDLYVDKPIYVYVAGYVVIRLFLF